MSSSSSSGRAQSYNLTGGSLRAAADFKRLLLSNTATGISLFYLLNTFDIENLFLYMNTWPSLVGVWGVEEEEKTYIHTQGCKLFKAIPIHEQQWQWQSAEL